jgi:predicted esterase
MRANNGIMPGSMFTPCCRRFTGAARNFRACWLLPAIIVAMATAAMPSKAQAGEPSPAMEAAMLLPGLWHGVHASGLTTYHHRFAVKREGAGYTALGIAWCGMTEAQADASLRGELDLALFPNIGQSIVHPMCVLQSYTVSLQGDTLTFQSTGRSRMVRVQSIKYFDEAHNTYRAPVNTMLVRLEQESVVSVMVGDAPDRFKPADPAMRDFYLDLFKAYPPDRFSGRLVAPGIIARDSAGEQQSLAFFRLWKGEALSAPRPPTPELGKTLAFACLDGGAYHYTCYLPRKYRPETAMPVLINFAPSGSAQPLAPNLAEEFGWIMVGLKESRNNAGEAIGPNRDAVLFDLQRRFHIDMKRLYFSGFSGGGRAAALAAFDYPDRCAGVLCIGASSLLSTPPRHIPIYFLVGETDMNRSEADTAFVAEKKAGRITALALHPGGHAWGRPEDQETALRWLAAPKP